MVTPNPVTIWEEKPAGVALSLYNYRSLTPLMIDKEHDAP
jgi:hypothetical protein